MSHEAVAMGQSNAANRASDRHTVQRISYGKQMNERIPYLEP